MYIDTVSWWHALLFVPILLSLLSNAVVYAEFSCPCHIIARIIAANLLLAEFVVHKHVHSNLGG